VIRYAGTSYIFYIKSQGRYGRMVIEQPINLGIRLHGKDLERFNQNLNTPECTPEGLQLIKEAYEYARKIHI
jgi:hypothetical protein